MSYAALEELPVHLCCLGGDTREPSMGLAEIGTEYVTGRDAGLIRAVEG